MRDLTTVLVAGICYVTIMTVGLVVFTTETDTRREVASRNECRAANPGYECIRGWVRGERFGHLPNQGEKE